MIIIGINGIVKNMRKIDLRIKLKKIIPNIIVLIASLFISLIFLEMILRFIVPLPLACALLDKDETLVYRNKANIDYLDKNPEYRVKYSTNSNGIRDNEVFIMMGMPDNFPNSLIKL